MIFIIWELGPREIPILENQIEIVNNTIITCHSSRATSMLENQIEALNSI